jgi:hypothetical protein
MVARPAIVITKTDPLNLTTRMHFEVRNHQASDIFPTRQVADFQLQNIKQMLVAVRSLRQPCSCAKFGSQKAGDDPSSQL